MIREYHGLRLSSGVDIEKCKARRCVVPISMNSPEHTGQAFQDFLNELSGMFKSLDIVIVDKLNLWNGYTLKQCYEMGDKWISENSIPENAEIIRYENQYDGARTWQDIYGDKNNNLGFKDAVDLSIKRFKSDRLEACKMYIFDEVAFFNKFVYENRIYCEAYTRRRLPVWEWLYKTSLKRHDLFHAIRMRE
jgi:hypothetical protein